MPRRFGPFTIDEDAHELRRDGSLVPLQPKAFDALTLLAARAGQVVPFHDLTRHLWPGVHVGEDALPQMIRRVRAALGDTERPFRWIVLVPKRGYRMPEPEAPPPAAPTRTEPAVPLYGREPELAAIVDHVDAGVQIVVLTGAGGMGKSYLARAALTALAPRFDGHALVDLQDARSAAGVTRAVAAALGIPLTDPSDDEHATRVGHALGSRRRFLAVLDDLDCAGDDATPTLTRWRAAAPNVTWLLTARRAPALRGERVVELGPLPPEGARALFFDRAAVVGPQADLDALLDRLDRGPLAIELAAARTRLLTVPQLLQRLDDRFDLLRDRSTDRPDRHRSLRACVWTSWERLDDAHQAALAALCALPGAFSVELAEALLTRVGVAEPLDALDDLRRDALLHRGAGPTLQVLETVRATVRSAPTAADAVMLGQQELVPTLIARHDAVVRSDPAGDERIRVTHTLLGVLDEIDDAPSIVAILHRVGRWLYEAGSRESGRRAINRALTGAAALSADELAELHAARVDVLLDPKHDGDDWVTTALAAAERAGRGDLSLRVRVAAANHALSRGTPVDVLAETARVLASAKAYGDVGVGLIGHASRVRVRALHQAALHAEAWDLLRGLDPEPDGAPERADTDVALARALAANGHVDEAVAHVARARDAYRRLGWRQREAVALANMGGDLVLAGRRAQAIELLTEALEVLQHIGERYAEIAVRCNLAVQHLFDFDHEAATGTLQVADMLCDRHHLTGTRAIVAHNLATAAWQRGDLAGALAHADRGSALATAAGATRQRGLIEAWRAGILAAMGDRGSADRALADAIQRLPAEDSAAAEVIEAIRHHVDGTDPSLVTARGPRSLMLRALLRRDRSDDGQGVVRRAP